MRKSFNGLSGLVREALSKDPESGDVFIFVNRRRDRIKLLAWDRTGFVIFYKRLEQGTFELPIYARGAQVCSPCRELSNGLGSIDVDIRGCGAKIDTPAQALPAGMKNHFYGMVIPAYAGRQAPKKMENVSKNSFGYG